MSFRITILSPLKASASDLARRQRRYEAAAAADTRVTVHNLAGGPPSLESSGDILVSAAAMFEQGGAIGREQADAILVDCVFDPAIEELREATGLPTFGPTRATLPLVALVAPSFSIVARTRRQCELLAELVGREGHGERLCSARPLDISYAEAKQPEIFDRVMVDRLRDVVGRDGARAVMFGSTTMALTGEMRDAAEHVPLFMPGIVTLRLMEQLWRDGLWPG